MGRAESLKAVVVEKVMAQIIVNVTIVASKGIKRRTAEERRQDPTVAAEVST